MSKAKELAAEVNAALGGGTLKMGNDPSLQVNLLPTGVLPFDDMLGGGLPRGRWVEVYGDYSTLKSYVGYKAIATTQANGGVCALVDTEHAWDPEWGETLGIDIDNLIVDHPASGEAAVDTTEVLVRNKVDLILWDSVAATLPEGERDKREEGENANVAELARLLSRAARKLTTANHNHTALMFINQTRMQIGQVFGNPETTPGGKAMGFYASHRVGMYKSSTDTSKIKLKVGGQTREVTVIERQLIRAQLAKSKLTKPFGQTYFYYDLSRGEVDEVEYAITWGIEHEVIENNGAHYKVPGVMKKSVHGFAKFAAYLRTHDEVMSHLLTKMEETWREKTTSSEESDGDPAPAKKKAGARKRASSSSEEDDSTQ